MSVWLIIIITLKITTGKCKKQRIWTAQTPRTTFSCLFERFSWRINLQRTSFERIQRFGFRLHIRNSARFETISDFQMDQTQSVNNTCHAFAGRAPVSQSRDLSIKYIWGFCLESAVLREHFPDISSRSAAESRKKSNIIVKYWSRRWSLIEVRILKFSFSGISSSFCKQKLKISKNAWATRLRGKTKQFRYDFYKYFFSWLSIHI